MTHTKQVDGKRYYQVGEDSWLPSVTTILKATNPKADSLIAVPGRCLEGTALHLLAGEYLLKRQPIELGQMLYLLKNSFPELTGHEVLDLGQRILPYWRGADRYLGLQTLLSSLKGKVILLEQSVHSEKYGFAGTLDILWRTQNNVDILFDVKSFGGYQIPVGKEKSIAQHDFPHWRKSIKKEKPPKKESERGWEWLHYKPQDCFMQLIMYKLALQECLGIEVAEVALITTTLHKGAKFLFLPHQMMEDATRLTIERIKKYHEQEAKINGVNLGKKVA